MSVIKNLEEVTQSKNVIVIFIKLLLNYFIKKTSQIKHPVRFLLLVLIIFGLGAIYSDLKFRIELRSLRKVLVPPSRLSYEFVTHDVEQLNHLELVLKRLGYKSTLDKDEVAHFLWIVNFSLERFHEMLTDLSAGQIVNHWPSLEVITSKVNLSKTDSLYIPKSFRIPDDLNELTEYAKNESDSQFMQKHVLHRSVSMKPFDELDLNNSLSFVQEFIDKPFLIDGHKFDIGVYTIVTSLDPLRVYIYNGDILFRYCPEKYHPFDEYNLNKYVLAGNYIPTWGMPSLTVYFTSFKYGMRDSFDYRMRAMGIDPDKIWEQIEEAIYEVIFLNAEKMKKLRSSYNMTGKNHFEMVRYDFIVDENLDVYLLEVNSGPNLSSNIYEDNAVLYEQLIYNMLSLVGIAHRVSAPYVKNKSFATSELMQSAERNVLTNELECEANDCSSNNCNNTACWLCRDCLDSKMISQFHAAYREHINKLDCKRVFPPALLTGGIFADEYLEQFSTNDKLMLQWFNVKCREDESWC